MLLLMVSVSQEIVSGQSQEKPQCAQLYTQRILYLFGFVHIPSFLIQDLSPQNQTVCHV